MSTNTEYDELSTRELAERWKVKPGTILRRLSMTGSYHGLRPKKLPNRFLIWRVPKGAAQ